MKSFIADSFIIIGLALLGVGLFLWLGLGVSLAVVGLIVLSIGVAGNVAEAPKIPRK